MKRKALILISLLLSLFGCKDGTETSLSSSMDKDKTIADENLNINLNYKFSSIVVDESKTTSYLKNIGMVYGSGFVFDLTQLISDEEKTAHLEYYFLNDGSNKSAKVFSFDDIDYYYNENESFSQLNMQEYFNVQNQISNCSFAFVDTKNKGNDVIDTFETTDAFYDFSMDIGQSFTKTTLIFTNNVLTKIIGVLPNSFKDSLVGVDGLENLTLYNEIEISDIGNAQAPYEVKKYEL